VVTGIPHGKAKAFSFSLSQALSSDHSCSKVDKVELISRKLKGWSQFYRHTNFTAKVYSKIARIVFLKLAKWLSRKYRCSIKSLMMKWIRLPSAGQATTWVVYGKSNNGIVYGASLFRLVSLKMRFMWRLPESNLYLRLE